MQPPSIAIITGTYNPNLSVFARSLGSIAYQKYKGTVKHYILDGGSTNGAVELASEYGARLLSFKNDDNEGGGRVFRALQHIDEDIVLILQSDNILPNNKWFSQMVSPFKDARVFSTYSMHNSYQKQDDILTKYFALFGSPDPTVYYLNKSDKVRMDQKYYHKGLMIKEKSMYYLVQFTRESQPVMGDNGFMIRTDILRQVVKKKEPFYHTDAFAQLLAKGHDTVGVVKNSIIHVSRPNIFAQVHRRIMVKVYFTDKMQGKRTYLVYNRHSGEDVYRLFLYIVFSLTFVEPLFESIRGYIKIRDLAWFLHPLMCFLMVFGYGYTELIQKINWIHRVFNEKK